MSEEYEERAAIMEFSGGLPRVWAEFFAHLTTMERPADYLAERWAIIREDACRLVFWLPQIQANGWTPDDVRRLISMIGGREIAAVGLADITVVMRAGNRVKLFWRPNPGGIARWDEGRRAA